MNQQQKISIDWEGESYFGSYRTDGETVTVFAINGQLSERTDGLPVLVVAKRLLRDLAQRGLA